MGTDKPHFLTRTSIYGNPKLFFAVPLLPLLFFAGAENSNTPDDGKLGYYEILVRKMENISLFSWWWIVGFATVAILLIVLCFLVKRKRWLFIFIPLIVVSVRQNTRFRVPIARGPLVASGSPKQV